jgi:hypothetical protein
VEAKSFLAGAHTFQIAEMEVFNLLNWMFSLSLLYIRIFVLLNHFLYISSFFLHNFIVSGYYFYLYISSCFVNITSFTEVCLL